MKLRNFEVLLIFKISKPNKIKTSKIIKMTAFHAYDIRGVYKKDFNKEDVYKIGFFISEITGAKEILIGRDVRESSPEIFEYLIKGIADSGTDAASIGISTTPMLYYATGKLNFDASIMITASHNPKEYNGLKVSGKNSEPIGYHNGLNKLEDLVKNKKIEITKKQGRFKSLNIIEEYIDFQKQYLGNLSNLKICVDCSNGMAGLLIRDILGNDVNYIFEELDGTFPNHEANPLIPKNIVALQKEVAEKKCDIGVIFDGDADRVMFTDENSEFIPPDLLIALLSDYFPNEKGHFLQDIRSSKAVSEYIGDRFTANTWKVGRAFAAKKLRELNGVFGGELAGHYYFKDFYFSDSGIMAALIFLDMFARNKAKGINVSTLISKIKRYENSGEINFEIENKKEVMENVKNFFINEEKPEAFFDFDGYRIEYKDWWFNIRPSNTEPYLRLIAEAKNKELLESKLKIIKNIIKS